METNEQRNNITVKQVLEFIVRDLDQISVPAGVFSLEEGQLWLFKGGVMDVIDRSKKNLIECLRAMERARLEDEGQDEERGGEISFGDETEE